MLEKTKVPMVTGVLAFHGTGLGLPLGGGGAGTWVVCSVLRQPVSRTTRSRAALICEISSGLV
jgi:hypothetical protein